MSFCACYLAFLSTVLEGFGQAVVEGKVSFSSHISLETKVLFSFIVWSSETVPLSPYIVFRNKNEANTLLAH